MPISGDQFEELGDGRERDRPTPGTNAAKILEFLRGNPNKAFTRSEIAAETDAKTGSIGPTLVRLRERGRVDHRGTNWRVSDHDRSLDAFTGHAAAALAEREDEEEIPETAEGQEHAVDRRDHRDGQ